jgi:hypothetical protein
LVKCLFCPPAYEQQVIVGERHIVENNHSTCAIEIIMNVTHITKEGGHMNILKDFISILGQKIIN